MDRAADVAVKELRKNWRETLDRARGLRKLAAAQPTAELAEVYFEQARFEIDKARGYLKQASALEREFGLEEDDGAA
jgi:hypothetical protein